MAELTINLQFGGGAELLFDKIKKRKIELPALKKYFPDCCRDKWTIKDLLLWIKDNLLREREEGATDNTSLVHEKRNRNYNNPGSTSLKLPALKKYFPDCCRDKWTIKDLLLWIKDNLLREREELFLQGESVRPGILVLVNDTDWELAGELHYELLENDCIMFISTLHGG